MLIIYKITILGCDKVYIGSTKNFNQRKYQHIDYSKHYFNTEQKLYYIIRENGGWENCLMEIIEENTTIEREQYWINHYADCVINIRQPIGMTEEQKKEKRKINAKRHYDKLISNSDRLKKRQEYMKEYHKNKKLLNES